MTAIRKLQEFADSAIDISYDDYIGWKEEFTNIHACAVEDLIKRGFVRFAGVKLVEADVLCIKVQDAAEKALKQDHECNLGQLLVALKACNYDEARRLADLFLGKDKIRDLAGYLVNAKEDEIYRLYVQEAA
ncbi:hypothetical protein [Pseudomonas sp.]|uniref:hypothetical protein n=1 Tax=Pseudomonas sp. TaxID=306 RepID=UPI0031D09697